MFVGIAVEFDRVVPASDARPVRARCRRPNQGPPWGRPHRQPGWDGLPVRPPAARGGDPRRPPCLYPHPGHHVWLLRPGHPRTLRVRFNPLNYHEAGKLRGARPAGPPPRPSMEPVTVQRKASSTVSSWSPARRSPWDACTPIDRHRPGREHTMTVDHDDAAGAPSAALELLRFRGRRRNRGRSGFLVTALVGCQLGDSF